MDLLLPRARRAWPALADPTNSRTGPMTRSIRPASRRRAEDRRPRRGQVDHRGFDTDPAWAAIKDQVHCRSQLFQDMSRGRGADVRGPVGARSRDGAVEGAQQCRCQRMVRAGTARRTEGRRSPGERRRRDAWAAPASTAPARRPGSALGRVRPRRRVRAAAWSSATWEISGLFAGRPLAVKIRSTAALLAAYRGQAVNEFGRERHQAAAAEDFDSEID